MVVYAIIAVVLVGVLALVMSLSGLVVESKDAGFMK